MKINMIKVGYLVSYDYGMLLTSIKQLYWHVDKIVVAIDKDSRTWSGNKFEIPNSFFEEIKAFDSRNVIELYFDNFYISSLSPVDCESRERDMVLRKLGSGWKIQLDVDEYIYDFKEVVNYLNKYWYLCLFPKVTPICFKGCLITLFRQLPEGYLYIDNNERFPFITNQSYNIRARNNNKIRNHYTNISVIHQSWARTEIEVLEKINNWGHRDDFDTYNYFEFWRSLTITNSSAFKNIHPIVPEVWDELHFMPSTSIDDFISKYEKKHQQKLIYIDSFKMIKALFNKIFK